MKKQDKTFAQRAREIKNKYKRADYDNIEKQEMISELRKLRDEQEQYRVDSGIAEKEEQEDEYGTGGPYGGLFYDPSLTVKDEDLSSFKTMKPDIYSSPSSSILPTAISAGFSLAGNAIGMANANKLKNRSVYLPRVAPSSISLESERQALGRRYNNAINTLLANTRTGNNADRIAAYTSLTNSLGEGLSQSYMNEANTNAQYRQQASSANAEIGSREELYNAERRDKYNADRAQYRDAMFNIVPMALRDYRQQVNSDIEAGIMGKDYGLYYNIPGNETFMERLRRNMLGNQYQILPREYVKNFNGLQ